ncbi:energy transducer TonB [Desulfonauticus submarinus]
MRFLFFIFSLILHIFLFFSLSSHFDLNLKKNIKYSIYKVQLVNVQLARKKSLRIAKKKSLNTLKNIKKVVKKDNVIKIADKKYKKNKKIKKINKRSLDKNATSKRKAKKVDIKGIIASLEKEVKTSKNVNIAAKEIKNLEKEIGYYGNNKGIVGKNVEEEHAFICSTKIKQNWRMPFFKLGEHFITVVAIKIDKTGKILHAEIKKASGNKFFDETALKAIYLTSTLPPPPQGIEKNDIEIIFDSEEAKR